MQLVDTIRRDLYAGQRRIIDVRTPDEYARGHIPGAFNIPLLSNQERAIVGTAYVREGSDKAIDVGMNFVAPRLDQYLLMRAETMRHHHVQEVDSSSEHPLHDETDLVYCWRGGLRSASLSWFFNVTGYPSETIQGGYKAYRRMVLADLERPWPFIVIGGYTGSGKTEVLQELRRRGAQVLDLEDLCNHRGSAFGSLSMPPQPKSEHAMNHVHKAISELDITRPIYVEDESRHIGSVWLHEPFYQHLRSSPLLFVRIPRSERARYLASIYGNANMQDLEDSFRKIAKPLGGDRLKGALAALAVGDVFGAADLALDHYDRAYAFGLEQREQGPIATIDHSHIDVETLADRILHYGNQAYKS